MKAQIHEIKELRNRTFIFEDRFDAAEALAGMLAPEYEGRDDATVVAIPSGGVPLGVVLSRRLGLPLDLVIVRKINIPGSTEAGFGALTLDGSAFLNERLVAQLGLTEGQIEAQKEKVMEELKKRNRLFRAGRPAPALAGRTAIVVDDGLASGFTMMASVHAMRNQGAKKVAVAVPTAPLGSIERIESVVEEVYCANVRHVRRFAVADAYKNWRDLKEDEVLSLIRGGL